MKAFYTFFIHLVFFSSLFSFSQENIDNEQIYESFDEVIGLHNTDLYKGVIYKDNIRRMRNNTNFFLSSDFVDITIKYNNNWYYNIEAKYDIYSQKILVKLLDLNNNYILVELINQNVDEFIINNKRFIKIRGLLGFYEVLLNLENLNVYKKHQKKREEIFEEGRLYDKFKTVDNYLVVNYKNQVFEVRRDKDFLKILKDEKKVKKIVKKNKKFRKTSKELFFVKSLEDINVLLSM